MARTALALSVLLFGACAAAHAAPSFSVSYSKDALAGPVDGRLLVIVAVRERPEPRSQVNWGVNTAQVFGIDVDAWKPGKKAVIGEGAPGHPLRSINDLPAGTYHVQALLNVYETFNRRDGHVLKLPADNGEGQRWSISPGNLYSVSREVEIKGDETIEIELTQVNPPIETPEDTPYVRRVSIQSERLTEFWGRPVQLSAIVLVPEGFDENPDARYPVLYQQGHFPSSIHFFRETPPLQGDRRGGGGYEFYQHWTSGRMPEVLLVLTQHATPYYDDSYGVNSSNMGPYGDALIHELYPHLEQEFRAIGEPWARVLYGGSTGGWISLAQQIFYPDFFGGAWGLCPDPVDFHAFQLTDLYDDTNAYYDEGPFKRVIKPLGRSVNGDIFATVEDFSNREEVIGTRGRSGGQLDGFHAVFGPTDDDGYPAELWDPLTGKIDPQVSAYWQENYDLTAILKKNWETLGPKLVGKLHVTMGTKDTFYLDGAAHLLEEFLESTKAPGKGPYYAGSFEWGDNEPHCYAAVPEAKGLNAERYFVEILAEHIRHNAPHDADMSWYGR